MKTNIPHAFFPRRLGAMTGTALLCAATIASSFAQPASRVRDDDLRTRRVETTREIKNADRNFVEKAARSGMDEVEVSRIVAARTQNPDVRQLAQTIVADHEAVHDELTSLAAAKGISLPAKDAEPNKWAKRDAKDFDRDYLDKLVSDHNDTVRLFEKQAKDGEDAEIVAFARKHLPRLLKHQQHAIDLRRVLKN